MDAAPSPLDNSLCQQPSIQPDSGSSEGISSHDSSRSSFHGGLQPEDESLDSLDTSRNRTAQDNEIGSLTSLIQSPQHSSGQHNATGDSGFSSESASLIASHSESSGTVFGMELETPIQMNTDKMKSYIDYTKQIGEGGFGNVYKGIYAMLKWMFDYFFFSLSITNLIIFNIKCNILFMSFTILKVEICI